MTVIANQGEGRLISRADEIGNRYGLVIPPELTAQMAHRRWRELNRLIQTCMVLSGVGRDRRPFRRLLRTAGTLVGASRGIFYVRYGVESGLELAASSGFPRGLPEQLRSGGELAAAALRVGKPVLVCGPVEVRLEDEVRLLGGSSCVSLPILREGQPWGVLQLMRHEAFSEEEAVLLWMYVLVVEDALPGLLQAAHCAESPVSPTHPPGLTSFRVLETRLERELEVVLGGGRSCTLLRISCLPDREAGGVERTLGRGRIIRVVRGCLRPMDLLAPEVSGDLLAFLPERNFPEGQKVVQRMRRALIQSRVLGEETRVIPALRIVQATCPEQGMRREDLFRSLESQT